MMKILYIVPYVPDRIRVRPYNLIRNLNSCGHQVTLATLFSDDSERASLPLIEPQPDKILCEKLEKKQVLLNCAGAFFSLEPIQASYCWHPQLARNLSELVKKDVANFDIIHIEHIRGVRYGLLLKKIFESPIHKSQFTPPIIWDSVDCISYLFKQAATKTRYLKAKVMTVFETRRTARFESWLLSQFDEVLVSSSIDKEVFQSLQNPDGNARSISVLANGVDLEYFSPNTSISRNHASIVFTGKMSYHANISMVLHLVNDIMPNVWEQRPDVELWIVGKDPPNIIRQLNKRPSIKVTGMVGDIRPFLQNAAIAVVPMTYGAGIQNKLLEAMACGTPVITSPQAVAALKVQNCNEVVVAGSASDFTKEIIDLLDDSERRNIIGNAGRKYVERNHDWGLITHKLVGIYQDAITRKRRGVENSDEGIV